MTDGQREILYVGMKMEQDRILKVLDKNLGKMDWNDLKKLIKSGE